MHATANFFEVQTQATRTPRSAAASVPATYWHSDLVGILPEKSDFDQPRPRLTNEAMSLLREMQDFDRF